MGCPLINLLTAVTFKEQKDGDAIKYTLSKYSFKIILINFRRLNKM